MITTSIELMHIPSGLNISSRLARIIGGLVLVMGLAACSAIKLGYNNVDELMYWWIDSYIDLNSVQDTRVREDLDRLHLWHRQRELPVLAETLRALEPVMAADISPAQVCAFVPVIRERVNAVLDRAEPAITTFALGIAPEQFKHLQGKFERVNRDYESDWIQKDAAARKERRYDQQLDRAEMVYGRLDDAQRALLRASIDKSMFDPVRALAERKRRQQDALQSLRKAASQPVNLQDARTQVRSYLKRLQASPDASWRAYEQGLINESCATFSALHNSTNAAQRESAVRRLRAWQRDLRELAIQ
ncbi:MAG: DUF6279 family lipoprotein [Ramlibacter sp.]|nr:DUF6279 family lipoprotein [Ramlibacter sp.]